MSPAEPNPHQQPRILLLPGMDGTELLFGPLRSRLAELGAPPIVIGYPETGPNRYEDLLPYLVTQVAAAGECVLVGWSFSGPLALRAAQRCDNVRGVVLAASFVEPPRAVLRHFRALLRAPVVATIRTLRRLPIWLFRSPQDPLRRAKAAIWQRVPPSTLAVRSRSILAVDAGEDLRRCPVPVHYLASSNDHVVTPRSLERIHELRPNVTCATIAGGHFALYSNADAGADAILGFVDSVAAASPGTRLSARSAAPARR